MLSHMLLLSEKVLLEGGLLEIELHDGLRYRLRYRRRSGELIEYRDGVRTVRGHAAPYEFRSVEQLRYDFEKDVAEA
jgi:hypothetical protein